DVPAPQVAQLGLVHLEDVAILEQNLTARDLAVVRAETKNGFGGDALAAAGLADNAEEITAVHIELCILHRLDFAQLSEKGYLQILDFQQMFQPGSLLTSVQRLCAGLRPGS